jgi:NitT/TauT family transport system substrate-binding protein
MFRIKGDTSRRVIMLTKALLLLWTLSAAFQVQLASWAASAKELKKVTLGRPAISLTILPLIVADEKGFFQEEGIEVQWINIRSDLAMVSLVNNQLDYSCAGTRSPQAAASGLPVRTVIVVNDRPQHGLVGQPEIADIRGIKGKSLAIASRGSMSEMALESILGASKIKVTEVNVVQIGGNDPNRITALKNRAVDAILVGVPFDQRLVNEGYKYLGAAREHMAMTVGDLATSVKKINDNPDEVTRMVRASLRGLRYVHSNKDDVVSIIAKYYKIDRDLARASYEAVIDTFPKQGLPAKGAIEGAIAVSKLTTSFKAEDAVDFRILNKLLKSTVQ